MTRQLPARLGLTLLAILFIGCAGGCPREDPLGDDPELTPSDVAWSRIVAAHNQRVNQIDQMWSRAVVEIRWVDEQGKRHFEQGDGPLIIRKPGQTALAIGKLGKTRFWLGSDPAAYWLFELGEPRVAYFGEVADAAPLHVDDDYPMPVRPDRLIDLLGLMPLPVMEVEPPRVSDVPNGHRQVMLPEPDMDRGWTRRVRFDPEHRISDIAWLTPEGEVAISVALGDYRRLDVAGTLPGGRPQVPANVTITLPQREASAKLFLSDMQFGEEKVKDVQFDFEHLLDALKIERIAELDGDRRPERIDDEQ